MAAWIDSVLSPLKSASEIVKGVVDVRDQIKLGEMQTQLLAQIVAAYQGAIAAQSHEAAMLEENRGLREKVAHLENWQAEKKRYRMHQLPPGITVYALKPEEANGDPPHYACANCYQRSQIRVLQPLGTTILRCHECGSELIRGDNEFGRTIHYRPVDY